MPYSNCGLCKTSHHEPLPNYNDTIGWLCSECDHYVYEKMYDEKLPNNVSVDGYYDITSKWAKYVQNLCNDPNLCPQCYRIH